MKTIYSERKNCSDNNVDVNCRIVNLINKTKNSNIPLFFDDESTTELDGESARIHFLPSDDTVKIYEE